MKLKSILSLLVAGAFLGLIACSGGANFSETCSSDDDCASGLFCETRGYIAGLCTKDCTKNTECTNSFGSDAFCSVEANCVRFCGGSGGSCPDGTKCVSNASSGLVYCAK